MRNKWPFQEPENTAVFTTDHVVEDGQPIVRVTHDLEDGAWQFHALQGASGAQPRIIALHEVVDIDSTVLELADLPPGWVANRESKDSPWHRSPKS